MQTRWRTRSDRAAHFAPAASSARCLSREQVSPHSLTARQTPRATFAAPPRHHSFAVCICCLSALNSFYRLLEFDTGARCICGCIRDLRCRFTSLRLVARLHCAARGTNGIAVTRCGPACCMLPLALRLRYRSLSIFCLQRTLAIKRRVNLISFRAFLANTDRFATFLRLSSLLFICCAVSVVANSWCRTALVRSERASTR